MSNQEEQPPKKKRGRPTLKQKLGEENGGRRLRNSFFTYTINTNKSVEKLRKEGKLDEEIELMKKAVRETFTVHILKGNKEFSKDDFLGNEAKYIERFENTGSVELTSNYQNSARLHFHGILYVRHRSSIMLDRVKIRDMLKEKLQTSIHFQVNVFNSLNEDQLKYPFKNSNRKLVLDPSHFPKKRK